MSSVLRQPHANEKRVEKEEKRGNPYANIEKKKDCALANAAPRPDALMVPVLAQRLRICKNHYQGGHDINVVCISKKLR